MKRFFPKILTLLVFGTICIAQETNGSREEPNVSDRPLEITHKPQPKRRDGQDCATGTVVLRVTFLSSGVIGEITAISRLSNGLTESAIEAAKEIKFKPAIKDGKAVTVTKSISYSFTFY